MSKPRILIVEDESIVAMDIERGVKALGDEVVGATGTGAEAVDLAGRYRPDLVLMDVRLQGPMDGIEAACRIRQRFHLPVIFLTAYADETTVHRAKAANPFGYLLKPFDDAELHSAIEIAVHKLHTEESSSQQADEALRRSERRFELLVESLKDYAVMLLDTQGQILSWNSGAQHITGYAGPEILGQHISVFFQPEEVVRNRPEQLLWRAEHEGRVSVEGWHVRQDGSRFWADIVVTALRGQAGQLVGFAEITRDVTERKRMEEEVHQLNGTLEQRVRERTAELSVANQDLEAFTYTVAHDLRAPLRGLLSFLFFLQKELGPEVPAKAAEYLKRGAACADKMSKLIDDLLHLARVGKQTLNCQPVALGPLILEATAEIQAETTNRQIAWRIAPLPIVEGDAGLIRQLFINLLANAVKYTSLRQQAIIEVGRIERGGEMVFFVRDNGVGFDMRYVDKLFQPFSRLHREEQFEGTGIGLATVERIVRKHGGRVWAEAQEDHGASFYFTLRARLDRAPEAAAVSTAASARG